MRLHAYSTTACGTPFHLAHPYLKSESPPLFFPRDCRPAAPRVTWIQSPTTAPAIEMQSNLTVGANKNKASRLAWLSSPQLRESCRPLNRSVFVERPKKRGLKRRKEKTSCGSVSQKNSVVPARKKVEDEERQAEVKKEPEFKSADVTDVEFQLHRSKSDGCLFWLQGASQTRASSKAEQSQPAAGVLIRGLARSTSGPQ